MARCLSVSIRKGSWFESSVGEQKKEKLNENILRH